MSDMPIRQFSNVKIILHGILKIVISDVSFNLCVVHPSSPGKFTIIVVGTSFLNC